MKRSAMPIYLTTLALSDTSLLYTGLLRYWLLNVFDLDIRASHTAVCKVHTWLVYSLTMVSAWILTFMTVERTLSVWKPHRVSVLCTRPKAAVIVVCIVSSSLAVNSHLVYGLEVVDAGNRTYGCIVPDPHYLHFFNTVWAWVDLTLASLIPFTALLVGNSLILCKIYSSVRSARYLGSVCGNGGMTQRKKTMSSMTVTLVALSVIFFMTTSPICVYNVMEHYIYRENQDAVHGPGEMRLAWAIVNILLYTNNTLNFYLYCLSGTNFRKELRKCLCCRPEPPRASVKNVNHLNDHLRHSQDGHPGQQYHPHQDPRRLNANCLDLHDYPDNARGELKNGPDRRSLRTDAPLHTVHLDDTCVDF
ncbi:hypothetical protein ACOMHN_002905 [Nucella lapillus]